MRSLTNRFSAASLLMMSLPSAALAQAPATSAPDVQVTIHADRPGLVYSRQIFGQFAEHLGTGIYGGVWVGPKSAIPNIHGYRTDVLEALRALKVPVIRWPGGCFADEYHWRNGIGPAAKRPVKVTTHWGGVTEPNTFGTNEFMNFAELVGAEAYVSGNVGSAPPEEMEDWIEYMTYPAASSLAQERTRNGRKDPWSLPYFGIGNELWGCGGQMRAEYAADVTRRYSTFIKPPAGTRTMRVASGANNDDYHWTEVMMRDAGGQIDGIGMHYYTVPGDWATKGSALDFGEEEWAEVLAKTKRIDEYITRHSAIMDKYDPDKRVALLVDEWGTWYTSTPGTNPGFLQQQNSLRDAMVAAVNLNIFAHHVDRVRGTNIAQMVNVLQAMILTDGPKMVRTPTYWVYDLYKPYQDATVLPLDIKSPWYSTGQWGMPAISGSAVRDKSGRVHIALANLDPNQMHAISIALNGLELKKVSGLIITAGAINAVNTYDAPNTVVLQPFNGATVGTDRLTVALPSKSIVMLDLN